MRNRAWRRSQRDRFYALALVRTKESYKSYNSLRYNYIYSVKTSATDHVMVTVRTYRQHDDFVKHRAKLSMNTQKRCGCSHCINPRKAGFGNSAKATRNKDRQRRCYDAYSFSDCEYIPNSKWRSVKAKTLRNIERYTDENCGSL